MCEYGFDVWVRVRKLHQITWSFLNWKFVVPFFFFFFIFYCIFLSFFFLSFSFFLFFFLSYLLFRLNYFNMSRYGFGMWVHVRKLNFHQITWPFLNWEFVVSNKRDAVCLTWEMANFLSK